ncbi:MAG: BMC domain-containing protein [Acidobacteriota bacterium]|nr:BMC domain-containing protein [Acidobacteriota bacterium]
MAETIQLEPALALLELASIAAGIRAGDAMAKRTPLSALRTGTVHPGKYLILAAGQVAEVEEALDAAEAVGTVDCRVFLPAVHDEVVRALCGGRRPHAGEALGVMETTTVPAILEFADAAVKGAEVSLTKLALADGLGGKGYALLSGAVYDIEAAMEIGEERLSRSSVVERVVISQLDPLMAENLLAPGELFHRLPAAGES